MSTLHLEKGNPFKTAWEWLQEKAAHRRGTKYLEQQRKEIENAPLTENQKIKNRTKAMNQSMAGIDEPLTPEQIAMIQTYIQQNLLPTESGEEENLE